MKTSLFTLLNFFIILVIVTNAGGRRRNRKNKNSPGYRRHVVNDEGWEEYMPQRYFEPKRPWRRSRYNLGFNSRNKWFDFGFEFDFDLRETKHWYEGPNVCTHKNVIKNETSADDTEITSHHVIKTVVCDDKGSTYKCTNSLIVGGRETTTVEIMECCRGYTRKESQHGCPTAVSMKNLVASLKDLKLTKFLEAANISGLDNNLRSGKITVFAPLDKAFDNMSELLLPNSEIRLQDSSEILMVSQPLIDNVFSDLKAILLSHISPEIYTSGRLTDEQMIDTTSPYKNKIRINFYDDQMTANCIKVKSRDNRAKNGVIHVTEKVLEPVTKTLLDIVSADPEMSYFKTAIGKTGLGKSLREEGQMTLFAPTDSAFRKMDPVLLARLLDGETDCLKKLLQNHILPNVICSAAMKGKEKSRNWLQKFSNITRDADDKLFIDDAQIVDTDLMATNGVLFVIDAVLVPDEALDVLEIAKKSGASSVVKLINQHGLAKTLQTATNVTLFAPSDEAIANFKNMSDDPAEVIKILTYHIVPSEVESCKLYNDVQLDTLNSGKKIRINEYTTAFPFSRRPWSWVQTAQCATVTRSNIPACNGNIYIIDKVLQPPVGKLLDILASEERFSELVQLIKIAGIGDRLEENGPFTLLAPTNDAFSLVADKELEKIVNDKDKLRKFLNNHIHKDQLCCSGIRVMTKNVGFSSRRLKMLSDNSFKVQNLGDKLTIGKAGIDECDLMSTNGVIHVVDKVIMDRDKYGIYSTTFSDFSDLFMWEDW